MKIVSKGNLAHTVYAQLKSDIFDFRLLPGDRFTETEVAERLGVSRTPVREALYKLERDGYLFVSARNGWNVQPFDFESFENLYDVRIVLELAAVRKLCEMEEKPALDALKEIWLSSADQRERGAQNICDLDEQFHAGLVAAAGNPDTARIHAEITGRIRIIRRLDFTQDTRIDSTYDEHSQILRNIMRRKADPACMLLKAHIEGSKAVVRQITLHRLHTARQSAQQRPARKASL